MMMKKIVRYLMGFTVLCCVTACSDDKDDHLERWMNANTTAFNQIKNNPEYMELRSPGNEGSIYYKVLQKGDGTDTIRYTSSLTCYYKGWLVADYPYYNIKTGRVFDQRLFDDGTPSSFTLAITYNYDSYYGYTYQTGGVINGWKTALQHMVKGDKWEVWIPYQLGYGRDGSKDSNGNLLIPGYSTLVFEIEIVSVTGVDDK